VGDVFIETTPDRDRVILSAAGRGESQARINNVFYGPFPVTGKYVVYGRESGDRLTASGNLNVPVEFHGGDGRDYLAGGRFDDTMFGDNGNDTILTGDGDNTAFGGNGNDNITARGGSDLLVGDGGNDRLQGGSGSDIIYGDDLLHAEVGTDQLVGGNGPDLLVGGFGNDILSGGAGNDVLLGGAGEDLIRADRGNDLIVGGSSGDSLFGGGGSDKLVSGTAANEADTLAVLQQVLLDWANTADYSGLGGFTGDGASDVDGLNGNGGADEYFIGPEDVFLLSGGDLPLVSI
jgi:Ca2+-binding RTX toxin-like protein